MSDNEALLFLSNALIKQQEDREIQEKVDSIKNWITDKIKITASQKEKLLELQEKINKIKYFSLYLKDGQPEDIKFFIDTLKEAKKTINEEGSEDTLDIQPAIDTLEVFYLNKYNEQLSTYLDQVSSKKILSSILEDLISGNEKIFNADNGSSKEVMLAYLQRVKYLEKAGNTDELNREKEKVKEVIEIINSSSNQVQYFDGPAGKTFRDLEYAKKFQRILENPSDQAAQDYSRFLKTVEQLKKEIEVHKKNTDQLIGMLGNSFGDELKPREKKLSKKDHWEDFYEKIADNTVELDEILGNVRNDEFDSQEKIDKLRRAIARANSDFDIHYRYIQKLEKISRNKKFLFNVKANYINIKRGLFDLRQSLFKLLKSKPGISTPLKNIIAQDLIGASEKLGDKVEVRDKKRISFFESEPKEPRDINKEMKCYKLFAKKNQNAYKREERRGGKKKL